MVRNPKDRFLATRPICTTADLAHFVNDACSQSLSYNISDPHMTTAETDHLTMTEESPTMTTVTDDHGQNTMMMTGNKNLSMMMTMTTTENVVPNMTTMREVGKRQNTMMMIMQMIKRKSRNTRMRIAKKSRQKTRVGNGENLHMMTERNQLLQKGSMYDKEKNKILILQFYRWYIKVPITFVLSKKQTNTTVKHK